jgi:hypothetical protein
MILTNLFPFVLFFTITTSRIEGIDTVFERSVDSIEKRSINEFLFNDVNNECNFLVINYLR